MPKPIIAMDRGSVVQEVNQFLTDSGQPAIPPPVEVFANPVAPLRVEIEVLLGRVLSGNVALIDQRNLSRRQIVAGYLDLNFPGNTRLKETILGDLESYKAWERHA